MLPCTLTEKDAQWSHYNTSWTFMSKPIVIAVLLIWDSLCYMLYACNVWKCTVCYADTGICCVTLLCLLNQTYVRLRGAAALRKHRARLWWWVATVSWSGSSWSDGEWSSPGPPHTPSGLTEVWLAPAWHSHCWNAEGKIPLPHSQLWSWRCCVCWRRCWWLGSGRCPLAQTGPPGCSCTCRQLTVGDPGTQSEIDRYSDFQRFWYKAPRRGLWDSSGSLHNSSSTCPPLRSYVSLSHTRLCLDTTYSPGADILLDTRRSNFLGC